MSHRDERPDAGPARTGGYVSARLRSAGISSSGVYRRYRPDANARLFLVPADTAGALWLYGLAAGSSQDQEGLAVPCNSGLPAQSRTLRSVAKFQPGVCHTGLATRLARSIAR